VTVVRILRIFVLKEKRGLLNGLFFSGFELFFLILILRVIFSIWVNMTLSIDTVDLNTKKLAFSRVVV
jgi:hypothetical protein